MELTQEGRDHRMKWWHEAIPVAEYEKLAGRFNPKPHPARDRAKLAERAGMRYMESSPRSAVAESVEAARAEQGRLPLLPHGLAPSRREPPTSPSRSMTFLKNRR